MLDGYGPGAVDAGRWPVAPTGSKECKATFVPGVLVARGNARLHLFDLNVCIGTAAADLNKFTVGGRPDGTKHFPKLTKFRSS